MTESRSNPQPPKADAASPLHELFERRFSPRSFASRPVEPAMLRSVLEAARWAPSSFNDQPWGFLVATQQEPAEYARLLDCLMPFNQVWAREAPVLLLGVARMRLAHNQQPNPHALYDLGAAVAHLALQATALGLYVRQMAGFHIEQARQSYAIPAEWEPAVAIALGHLGDVDALPAPLRERQLAPRVRKALSEFVFTQTWGKPLDPTS